jgi:hypothetical protein
VSPAASSKARRPFSELSVEWTDDLVEPFTHSQFQPPSGS